MTTLKTLSQDEKTRLLAQAREEYTRLHYEDLRASMNEGIEKGNQEGEANSLLRLLNKRFGDIPQEAEDRIKAACVEQIRQWLDQILDAESLEAVFATTPLR